MTMNSTAHPPPSPWGTHLGTSPNLFSRDTLELTFSVLRKHSPSAALEVRNQLAGECFIDNNSALGELHTEYFPITLDARVIGKIINAMTELGQSALETAKHDKGQLIVLRRLIKEWMALAEWIILKAEQTL